MEETRKHFHFSQYGNLNIAKNGGRKVGIHCTGMVENLSFYLLYPTNIYIFSDHLGDVTIRYIVNRIISIWIEKQELWQIGEEPYWGE